jgi:hypothetical protein
MFHPYRNPPAVTASVDRSDDVILAVMLIVVGGIRLAGVAVEHEVFGAESTIALFMVALALRLLVRRAVYRAQSWIPR